MAIQFSSQDIDFKPKGLARLRAWIKAVIVSEKKDAGEINYVFMNDQSLLKHNQQFLNHNTLTDIITFDYSQGKTISGDILISVERVNENAGKFEEAPERELRRVMIHGVLHLCGYKDKKKADKELMRKKEGAALRSWDKYFGNRS